MIFDYVVYIYVNSHDSKMIRNNYFIL